MKYYYEGSRNAVGKLEAENDIDAAVTASNELQKKKESLQLLFCRIDDYFVIVYENKPKTKPSIKPVSIESIESIEF